MGPNLMRMLIISTAALALAASAQAKSVWALDDSDSRTALFYGVQDSPEEVDIIFACTGGGAVEVTLPRTSEELKFGTDVTFTMTIGKAKSTLSGGTSDNQLDGIPTAVAMAGVKNPVIQALTAKGDLVVQVGKTKYAAPLATMGKKAKTFLEKCKSNM
jgi:hypothetical protein